MQSPDPLITVIVPTYNSAETLRCALQSLVAQDCADYEALVMGDGCTDESEAVVTSFNDARISWRNLAPNSGSQSEPNNEALRLARGKWIAYLGHDDLWFPWHLSGLVQAAAGDRADFVASTCFMLRPDGRHLVTGPVGSGRTHADQYTPPSSWLHRRDVVATVGKWRPAAELSYGIDFDYQRRIALAGFRCIHHQRLSVLKFPSGWWGNYDRSRPHPQAGYLQRIAATPLDVERDLLGEVLTRYVSEDNGARPSFPIRGALRALSRRIADGYGRDRWPLSTVLFWRQRRFMRRNRPRRGLPPK
ncbi:MAG: glycosyltransferase [Betaproteobacteria bacterium]